ncbi:nucleotidyltransferase domain-containing protein [Ignisphaera sp. 4213-co]|uniref:Nucleotidyltransferase domain-containing protein n=1 Tax=Ignisphaera cupida TaxID=3050454 RepID=A0ABD4Z5S8_9CREN|nr:nucleotidyltransferase domain-containing protein [Ignisphaera sp. 4213-co]MDK6028656.1 nucleotidyltransferase domain-containing protein [Ignisphaera sp. 4213-co]
MGEKTINGDWSEYLAKAISEIEKRFGVEALIVFGSWSRSGGGEWSDIDLLIITDEVRELNPLDRFTISAELKKYRVDAFFYTFEELESMSLKGNPLALSALIEGIALKTSPRVMELMRKVKKMYVKKGRTWLILSPNTKQAISNSFSIN